MSKQKECPSCAMEVGAEESVCPICQYDFPSQPKAIPWIAAVLVLAILSWLLLF